MRRMALMALVLVTVPALAAAQRGRGGASAATRPPDNPFGDAQRMRVPAISRHELEDLDPLAVLLDKRGDLKLSDDQTAKLRAMDEDLAKANAPAFHALDSLNLERTNLGNDPSDDNAGRVRTIDMLSRMVAGGTRQRYDSVETQALAVLTEAQKQKANDILKDDHDRLNRLTRRGGG